MLVMKDRKRGAQQFSALIWWQTGDKRSQCTSAEQQLQLYTEQNSMYIVETQLKVSLDSARQG